LLELSRQQVRKNALSRFKYLRTCMLARELCFLVRDNRAVLEKTDVRSCCTFISKLCNEFGCKEQSILCAKAAEAVIGNEETYLNLCDQSCRKCSESRKPRKPSPPEPVYVA
jgi:hypothetical protein